MLAAWARARVREALGGPAAVRPREPWCDEPAATFVSLHWPDGALQGCIGCLSAVRPIADDVGRHAVDAALHDPRARRLALAQVDGLELEISLLSGLEPVEFADEDGMLAAVRPGIDGLVLEHRGQRATLLPVMWEQLREPHEFLGALRRKAGLPRSFFSRELRLHRYTTDRYVDPAPAPSPAARTP